MNILKLFILNMILLYFLRYNIKYGVILLCITILYLLLLNNNNIEGNNLDDAKHELKYLDMLNIDRMLNLEIGESVPTRVCKGAANAQFNIKSEGFGNSLKIQGHEAALTTFLYPLYSSDPVASFYCSGQIVSQELSANSNDYLQGSLTIQQNLR